jgi:ethanolamine ammonia-lyase small subunit
MNSNDRLSSDPWTHLRRHTSARVALGRAGGSLPTAEVLSFAAAHAAARDAVHAALDIDELDAALRAVPMECVRLSSAAPDRQTYLRRPDLGRALDDASRGTLAQRVRDGGGAAPDLAIVLADGLSAPAAQRHAAPLLAALLPTLRTSGISTSPAFVVRLGRVAIEDEIGETVGARAALILLGERPGLGSPDSLGAYVVFGPRRGRTDAERNCVSNIRPSGLEVRAAAETLHYLISESLRRRISGVSLKDERGTLPSRGAPSSPDGVLPHRN